VHGLSIALSGAYQYAEFTENYTIIDSATFGNIVGQAGQQLPGSPKGSAAATVNYIRNLMPGYDLISSLNYTYSGKVWLTNFGILGEPPQQSEAVELFNLSASVLHDSWRMGLYVTNVLDKRVILSPGLPDAATNNLEEGDTINEPREIYLRVGYSF
jgi:outer membrane receptor protein involved in Fe transport